MRLKVKNVNIMEVHEFLGGGGLTKNIKELPKKGGLGQLAGDLAKDREEGVFDGWVGGGGGLITRCPLLLNSGTCQNLR